MGELIIRRKLKKLSEVCGHAYNDLRRWSWAAEDDARERLRALRSLEVDLLELRDQITEAIPQVNELLEVAMEDFRREQEAERERVAEVIQLSEHRRAA